MEYDLVAEVKRLSTLFDELRQQMRRQHIEVMNALDGLAKLLMNGKTEKVFADHVLRWHDGVLENHETRIGVLEGKKK